MVKTIYKMKGQFVKYLKIMGDTNNISKLTLYQDYLIQGSGNIVKPDDSYLILNDEEQGQFFFKERFSRPFNK